MLVLDANILIRAVLGVRVRRILEAQFTRTRFFCPDSAFAEARKHVPKILQKRGIEVEAALTTLDNLTTLTSCIDDEIYGRFEAVARQRLRNRDEEDWPVLATALALECPIWSEDAEFFGTGVATWTTDRFELLFREQLCEPGQPDHE